MSYNKPISGYKTAKERMEQRKKKNSPLPRPSDFVPTPCVRELERSTFNTYLDEKKAALVMFYDPTCHNCLLSKPHFKKVAKVLYDNNKTRGFGSVDCNEEPELCNAEGVEQYPTFKLYVGGKYINTFNSPAHAPNMIKFVENAPPVLDNPKQWTQVTEHE